MKFTLQLLKIISLMVIATALFGGLTYLFRDVHFHDGVYLGIMFVICLILTFATYKR